MSNPISPKVTASTVGAALASLVVVIVTIVWPDALTETQVAIVQGSVTVVLTALLGFLVSDPLRRQDLNAAKMPDVE